MTMTRSRIPARHGDIFSSTLCLRSRLAVPFLGGPVHLRNCSPSLQRTDPRLASAVDQPTSGCSFSDPRPAPPTAAQSNFTSAHNGTEYLDRFFFFKTGSFSFRETSIRSLLAAPECPLECRTNLYLSLDGCRLVTLPCTAFFLRDESESESAMLARPIAAHIDRGHISFLRSKAMRPWACGSNPPVDAIHRIKWKNLVPTEPLHDPYIAALLIALAR
ncbi:hypothetical protein TOPH_02077 [Tolypocladium ophioglossoides CBS 100239]|uniref:Uncharacterized protein n=1 Tax=Tolypocladium ophioglossoides (strain CBS 100239) TaxID=1163406 RepID=A0A0L0NFY5_TOLOC|nr:hypothetical protein TOPH_02077 [Tolypocladium ophioglossoides CBS 100239]